MDIDNNSQKNTIVEPENKNAPKKRLAFLIAVFEFLKVAALALIIVVPVRYFLFQPFIVQGESMAPNFASGDYRIVDEISYSFSTPQRGDVMVFKYPKDTSQDFIKRVIGLPGETIVIQNGKVDITKDDKKMELHENYLPANLSTFGDVKLTLGKDEYFVLGDNRDHSYDSRIWGVVTKKDIIGKPILRLFPLSSLSIIERPSY